MTHKKYNCVCKKHREETLAYHRQWRAKNRGYNARKQKEYRAAGRDKWYNEFPQRIKYWSLKQGKARINT